MLYYTNKENDQNAIAPDYPGYIHCRIQKERERMEKWTCTICGYIYDPAVGDPDNGIAPGTPFEKIPNTWVCPICGAGKEAFEKV